AGGGGRGGADGEGRGFSTQVVRVSRRCVMKVDATLAMRCWQRRRRGPSSPAAGVTPKSGMKATRMAMEGRIVGAGRARPGRRRVGGTNGREVPEAQPAEP